MNHATIRFHPILSLLLALTLAISSLAVSARSSAASGVSGRAPSSAPGDTIQDDPEFPNCFVPGAIPTCTDLQVFLVIDESSSMLYTDQGRQRIAGVKNVLDILAKEYYLPAVAAVDANAENPDPNIKLPTIQVSLIRFSSEVRHSSGWKTINPRSLDAWTAQRKTFDADLEVEIDYKKPQYTDFLKAFEEVKRLAERNPQTSNSKCPRLVMLFTDGVPNLGDGNLSRQDLTTYMEKLQGVIQQTFNLKNDLLYVTAFGSDPTFRRFWEREHQQKWEGIAIDSGGPDPRRVQYVPTKELALRMERIIGSTIGTQVYTLTPVSVTEKTQQYITKIPRMVASLRLTYYTINKDASFTVKGPDGKNISFTGEKTSIQVFEIPNPTPGEYQITTTAAGGLLTQMLRFGKLTAYLSSPAAALLQFTNGKIGIQFLGPDGKQLAISPEMSIQARLGQEADKVVSYKVLDLTQEGDILTASWMPRVTSPATVYACATLKDNGNTMAVLYKGEVAKINIDPLTVQVGKAENACVPNEANVSVPLQLINGRSQQPAAVNALVTLTRNLIKSPDGTRDGTQLNSAIDEIDARSGKYVLRFKPTSDGEVKFQVRAYAKVGDAKVGDANVGEMKYRFYDNIIPISIQPPRKLALTLEEPDTLGDRLSKLLYRGFHPGCIDDKTVIVIGRHIFGWFGPTQVQINGRFMDTSNHVIEPGIERFAVQMVSSNGGPSSDLLSSWTAAKTGGDLSTLAFPSPGLGLYNVTIPKQGKNLSCTVLDRMPTQTALLINDFWEYLVILILIIILMLLVFTMLRRFRNRRYGQEIPLILSSIVLIILNLVLVNLLVTQTLKCQLNCGFLIDKTLKMGALSFCNGINTPPIGPLVDFTIPFFNYPVKLGPFTITLVPALAEIINGPLQTVQKFIGWAIVLLIGLASLFLTSIVVRLVDSKERQKILINFSIWLIIFVLFCGLFYWRFVQ